ncbi:hypothetical protein [Pedobacter aquatilis]|uniref:hypothetical protein n=1 Tax=Pedobacter aquatilis TaxID=351343 RepID=UPI00292FD089|nr:hypothetical protein [Pedobacter aquatilis]
MRKYKKLLLFFLVVAGMAGCKKNSPNDIPVKPLAALTITNAISQGKFVRLNNNVMDSCALNSYKIFTLLAGSSSQIKAYASSSPNTPYFEQSPNVVSGGIYSLYLTGTHIAPEAVFVKDNIPPYPKQDVVNVRIVNLSSNTGPVNVTLVSAPTVKIFSNISYKNVTDFITLPLPITVPFGTDRFQIRDSNDALLFTYVLGGAVSPTSSRHRNITLVIRGMIGGTGTDALAVLGVPHY